MTHIARRRCGSLMQLAGLMATLGALIHVDPIALRLSAQEQRAAGPQFEVASVKVHRGGGGTTRRIERDRLTYLNITLGEFMQMPYEVKHYQIEGPDWITNFGSDNRYDVVAKAASPTSEQALKAMLVPLLAERFHVTVRQEARVL